MRIPDSELWDCNGCSRRGPPELFEEIEGRDDARRCECGGRASEIIGFMEFG